MTNNSQRRLFHEPRALSLPLGVALLGASLAAQAVIPVTETGPSLIQHFLNQLNTYTQKVQDQVQHAKENAHFLAEAQHMQQQLIQLQGFMASQMPMDDMFQERAENYGMADECPEASGVQAGLSLLRQPLQLDMKGDIKQQQSELCQRIVVARNAKYNETVKILKQLRTRNAEMQKLDQERSTTGTNQGSLDSNNNNTYRLQTRTQMDLDYWQATITAYDAYILACNQDQQRLLKKAMNGTNTTIGAFTQGAVLKAALEGARQHDR